MKKKYICWLIGSAVVMLLLPWAAVTFVRNDAGMAIALLLFFIVNPIYAITLGVFSGKHRKEMWIQPVIAAALFLLGTWTFFDPGESAFAIYAGVYLVFGIVSMLISSWLSTRKQKPM